MLKTLNRLSIGFPLIVIVLMLTPAYASQLRLVEGATLFYKGARISSGIGGYETFDASIKLLTVNQTTLVFQSNSTSINSNISSRVTVKYQDGIPTYADYLTALVYLPPKCIAQSLYGDLEWTTQINILTQTTTVVNKTSQILDFTVEAGTFQSINITLILVGPDYGTLTLIYDVNSGILIHEEWIPSYGDIIILGLTMITYAPAMQQTIINLILPAATLATPMVTGIHQTRRTLHKRSHKREQQTKEATAKIAFLKKPFYTILVGALLNLASAFLPWGQSAGSQIYLPLSLPSALTASTLSSISTATLVAVSIMAHVTAILAWLTIAIYIHTNKRLTSQLVAIVSSALAFVSALVFIQTGLTPSLGPPTTLIGGILTTAGIASTILLKEP